MKITNVEIIALANELRAIDAEKNAKKLNDFICSKEYIEEVQKIRKDYTKTPRAIKEFIVVHLNSNKSIEFLLKEFIKKKSSPKSEIKSTHFYDMEVRKAAAISKNEKELYTKLGILKP